jgi:hypothetical protein
VVRHTVAFEDTDGLLGASLRNSGVITFLFTSGLVAFHRWVCLEPNYNYFGIFWNFFCSLSDKKAPVLLNLAVLFQALRRACQLVLADQARYDKAWKAILADPVEKDSVTALCQYALEKQARCKVQLLQLNRCNVAGVSSGLMNCGLDGVLDPNAPVQSMDQLFCQAIVLSPILISKVQCWAAFSGGYFCSAVTDAGTGTTNIAGADVNENAMVGEEVGHCTAGFVQWLDVMRMDLQKGGQVRWAQTKSVQRSIEKSTRSYGKVF